MYRKRIEIQTSDPSRNFSFLANEIIKALKEARVKDAQITDTRITFSTGVYRSVFTWWSDLAPITSGEIQIYAEDHCIRYSLSFSQVIIVASLMVAAMGIAMIAEGAPLPFSFFVLPFMWFWIVGMFFVIGITRFSRLIKRAVRHAGFGVN
jgi:hypothetical protein